MTQDQRKRVWAVYEEAGELPVGSREEFIRKALPEEELRAKVRELLETADTPLDEEEVAVPEWERVGQWLGRFQLLAPVGRGGMGEVYEALDPDLGRRVAIKCISSRRLGAVNAIEALTREARAASALNHPGIVTIFEVIRSTDTVGIAMELVEGEPMRKLVGRTHELPQVALWGQRIAEALAATHARGIIHRDIKPENLIVRADGYVKVLDFGLAAEDSAWGNARPMGTLRYMSPEQGLGHSLTPATDIVSLGIVLYELATGTHPFALAGAGTSTLTLTRAVALGDLRPPSALRRGLPEKFDALLLEMLSTKPVARPTAAAVAARLESIAARRSARSATWWLAAAVMAALVTFLVVRYWPVPAPASVRLSSPVAITSYDGIEREPAISPDGRKLLFVWSGDDSDHDEVYMQNLAGGDLRRLTNDSRPKYSPVWSPDGHTIAWQSRARDGSETWIMVAPVDGPARLAGSTADHEGFYGVQFWPDGASLIASDLVPWGRSLVRINLADGSKTFLTREPGFGEDSPVVSPDRKRLLFRRKRADSAWLCALELTAPQHETCYAAPGTIEGEAWLGDSRTALYAGSGALWQVNMDGSGAHPVRIAEGEFRNFRNAPDGQTFVFNRALVDVNIWRLDPATGKETRFQGSSAEDSEPQYSPDGRHVVFRSNRTGVYELYLCEPDGTRARQITSLGGDLGSAVWSPDGEWIAFDGTVDANHRTRFTNILVIPSRGGTVRRVTPDDAEYTVPGWSADGRFLYCLRGGAGQVVKTPVAGGKPVEVFAEEMFDLRESPAGRFLYARREQGDGIWERRAGGGPGALVPGTEHALYRTWDLRGGRLFFLEEGQSGHFAELNLANGRIRKFPGTPPRRVLHGPRNLTASPAGDSILYSSEDLALGDIYLMRVLAGRP